MPYANAAIYFMSGTGNTYRAAKWAAEITENRAADVKLVPFEQAQATDSQEQLVGMMMPTHGFTAPWHGIRSALRMPRRKADAFVVTTRAGTKLGRVFLPGMEGTAAYLIALILTLKGYRVRGVMGLDMPSNWTAVHPGFRPSAADAIIGRARPRVEWFINGIISGEKRFPWGSLVQLTLGLMLLPLSLGYLVYGRFCLSKLFFATTACNGCAICAQNCPVQAIRMWGKTNPRPFWTFSCESCMRCMNYCPLAAIEAGQSLGVLLWYIGNIPVAVFVFDRLIRTFPWMAAINNDWGRFPLQYTYYLCSMGLAYLMLSALMRISFVNKLFTYTTFTHIYRRYNEPDTRLSDMTRTTLSEKCKENTEERSGGAN